MNEKNLPLCPFPFFTGFSNRPFSNSSIILPTFCPSTFFRDNRNCSFSKLIWETQRVEEWEERDEREEEEEKEEEGKEEEEEEKEGEEEGGEEEKEDQSDEEKQKNWN